jgi:hypothetical protein
MAAVKANLNAIVDLRIGVDLISVWFLSCHSILTGI